jgi:hypothetical protein
MYPHEPSAELAMDLNLAPQRSFAFNSMITDRDSPLSVAGCSAAQPNHGRGSEERSAMNLTTLHARAMARSQVVGYKSLLTG